MHHRSNRTSRVFAAVTLASFAAAATLSGCAKDPSKEVAKAKVEAAKADEKKEEAPAAPAMPEGEAKVAPEAAAATAAAAPEAPAGSLALSGQIDFTGSKVTGSHECTFKEWNGNLSLKDGKADGGALNFSVQTGSVVADYKKPNAWSEKLTGHLKSCDFFCVEKHPAATFASKSITAKAGENGATHEVAGDLTIRGVTKLVTFPATIAVTDTEVTGKASFSINRKEYKIEYPGKKDDLIREGVVLTIDVKASK